MKALKRYAQFYQLNVHDDFEKEDLAAMVARHFDCSLEVEEDDSIVSFLQRIRNGERNATKPRHGDKDRLKNEKKRKKSASRKRQREAPTAAASTNNGSGTSSSSGSSASGPAGGSSAAASEERKPSAATSVPKKKGASKKDDNGEDNELYCICNLPSYGNMIACDGKKCPNPSQWYHLECVGLSDGRHPDTWLCPECDPKGFAAFQSKKKKSKVRSKSPGSK